MALQRCFRAEDLIAYEPWPENTAPPLVAYHTDLIKTPRVCQEEAQSLRGAGYLGVLWVRGEQNYWGPSTISFLSNTYQVAWPGWNVVRWKIDGRYGRAIDRTEFGNVSNALATAFAFEPSGYLWAFDSNPIVYGFNAVVVDEATMSYDADLGALTASDFKTSTGADVISFRDMNVDRAADRLFARWTANDFGQVSIYRLSTKEWIADIFTPNRTAGIVLAPEGFAYVVDVNDWICVYDYNGVFHNAFRNPRRADYPGGFCYGWDKFYKRLLFVPGLANGTDGSSRLRVEGYYPVPEAAVLTPPIPRQVPRKGRTVFFVSHLCGEGAEPLGGRGATFSGLISASTTSDKEGDIVTKAAPSAAGETTLGISVDAVTTAADSAEPDHTTPGRTLVVDWVSPIDGDTLTIGATVTFTVRVTGAVGALNLTVQGLALFRSWEFAAPGTDAEALSVSFVVPALYSGASAVWTAMVFDATGNTGQSEQITTRVVT